jgi:hypothetical protein
MRELVGQELPPRRGAGRILVPAENDVGPNGVGAGGELVRRAGRAVVVMDAHIGKVVAKALLEESAFRRRHGLAAAALEKVSHGTVAGVPLHAPEQPQSRRSRPA